MWSRGGGLEITKTLNRLLSPLKHVPVLPIIIDEQVRLVTLFFRPNVFSKMIDFTKSMKAHSDVSTRYHRYGGLEFSIGGKEICHLHGDGLVDILLNRKMAAMFLAQNICVPHHVIKDTGWVSYSITKDSDVRDLEKLVQCAYDLRTAGMTMP